MVSIFTWQFHKLLQAELKALILTNISDFVQLLISDFSRQMAVL